MEKNNLWFGLFGTCVALVIVIFLSYPWVLRLVFAACTNTANMSLCKPAIGDSGWGTNINDNTDKNDTHDHSSGKGVGIPLTGMASLATDRVVGRTSTGSGTPEAVTFSDAAQDQAADTFADDRVWVADSATAGTPRTLTNCTDTDGNHLNYTQSTNLFSCGTSGAITTVRKTADETVNNSATLQNDDSLLLALAANETWYFTVNLAHIGNTTADFKWAFTIPSGATMRWNCTGVKINTANATTRCDEGITSGVAESMQSDTSSSGLTLLGVVINGSTAGNLQLQWAQDTATAVDTKVLTNSYLEAHK